MKASRFMRTLAVICAGGALIQIGGCGAALAPTFLGLLENVLLSFLFGGTLG
ncbi:MAG TPA: hypothetical protein VM243_06485 [Phycisphaerae bacterium]|nr:hypothetical protein [Phycisphaerae bacterium]